MVGSYAKSYYYSSTASNRDREDYRFSPFDGCPLQFTTYNNCSYLGNETNPYVLLVKCNNTSITSVEIHPNTKVIDNMAFYSCKSLTSVVIPDQVVHIGTYAFASCSALTNVTISASVKTIMTRAFYSCSALTSVTFNDTDTWYVASGTTVSVTDTALNATNLTNYKNYSYYIWTKDTATNAGKVFVDHAFWV